MGGGFLSLLSKPLDSYAIRVGILTWVRGGKTKVSGDISTV